LYVQRSKASEDALHRFLHFFRGKSVLGMAEGKLVGEANPAGRNSWTLVAVVKESTFHERFSEDFFADCNLREILRGDERKIPLGGGEAGKRPITRRPDPAKKDWQADLREQHPPLSRKVE